MEKLAPVSVQRGVKKEVKIEQKGAFSYIDTTGSDLNSIERKIVIDSKIKAPVKKGDKLGEIQYYLNGDQIGERDILAMETVEEITYKSALEGVAKELLL